MNDRDKTIYDLNVELDRLRRRISELESVSAGRVRSGELSESEHRYRTLFETMAQGVVYQAPDGRIISANSAAERILGVSLDQMQGRTSMDPRWRAIHDDGSDFPGDRHPAMEALRTGKPVHGVTMGVFHPVYNEYRWLLVDAVPEFLPGETGPYQVFTTFTDITERKQAEEALHAAKEYAENLIETANTIVVGLDTRGNITVFNRAAETLTGYSRSDLRNRNWFEVLTPKDRYPQVWAEFERLMANGVPKNFENPILTKSGEERYIVWQNNKLFERGKITGTISFGIDITERRHMEEALRESYQTSEDIVQAIPSGLFIYKYVPPDSLYLISGNTEAARITGIRCEEWKGRNFDEIWPAARQSGITDKYLEVIRTGKTFMTEDLHYEDARITGAFRIRAFALPGARLAVAFDSITEIKKAEQERLELERRLLHTQKLESLGVLAGGIAHDFNNLLMAILGNLDLALQKLSPVSPARANIEQSAQAARRATDLTRQMLAYSGKGSFVVKAIHLSELVEENAHLFRASVAKTAALDIHLDRSLPPIEADVGQVQQVIMNLITNASEAIGDNAGRIIVTTGVQDCDEQCLKQSRIEDVPPAARFVYLEVSDTGCGMDEQTKQRLFDPFFSTKATGRGLGMSAILGIVRGHRGAVFVESAVGRGTTIRILFPAMKDVHAEKYASADSGATAVGGATALSGTVLVVDDEEIVRDICKAMVESLGMRVFTAMDGAEAVEVFRKKPDHFSHVILDLTMPNMDGMTALKELRRIRPDVEIILSSGYNEQDSIRRLSGQGQAVFIQKPYSLKKLRDVLDRSVKKTGG